MYILKFGKKFTLSKKVSPSNTTDKFTWVSSNPQIATVNSSGQVTALKPGRTVITYKASSGKSDTCRIYVAEEDVLSLNYKAGFAAYAYERTTRIIYGKSVLGNQLEAYEILGDGTNEKTIFLDFAVHGYEDEYAKDGKVLTELANNLVNYYTLNPDKLGDYKMLIVPCANPDGAISGKNNYRAEKDDAFGRCTYDGVDMNRDFMEGRFYAIESQALRDLMQQYPMNIHLDVHGWEDSVIGDRDLVNIMRDKVDLTTDKSGRYGEQYGYIISYVKNHFGAKTALVELKNSKSVNVAKFEEGLNMIMAIF